MVLFKTVKLLQLPAFSEQNGQSISTNTLQKEEEEGKRSNIPARKPLTTTFLFITLNKLTISKFMDGAIRCWKIINGFQL